VLEAAQAAISTLDKIGLKCALFGSLASRLYGVARCPKDVDILTFPPPANPITTGQIQDLIVANDARFFLKMPKDPKNVYRILWFRRRRKRECKVDILIPGIMSLPDLGEEAEEIEKERITLPVLPFPIVLLQKLQGWSDHRVAPEGFKRKKQSQDMGDVRKLLESREVNKFVSSSPVLSDVWSNPTWFPGDFEEVSRRRVRLYCHYFPRMTGVWARLGFETV
ncbi:hypothetical protein BDQ17DRAFT_1198196, partial [Cyathus striatus]